MDFHDVLIALGFRLVSLASRWMPRAVTTSLASLGPESHHAPARRSPACCRRRSRALRPGRCLRRPRGRSCLWECPCNVPCAAPKLSWRPWNDHERELMGVKHFMHHRRQTARMKKNDENSVKRSIKLLRIMWT